MCGVFGIAGHPEAARLVALGLHALQHRGQESAGIAASDGSRLRAERGRGLAGEVCSGDAIARLPGELAIGHVRYSTTGGSDARGAQPLVVETPHGALAVAHNGNLTNYRSLRSGLERAGATFQTGCDTEVVPHLIARSDGGDPVRPIARALGRLEGAWSLLLLRGDRLLAARDPHGFRPLAVGRLDAAWVFASETCALDRVGARPVRDVAPGELIAAGPDGGLESWRPWPAAVRRLCVFEQVYFARPDSRLDGRSVRAAREEMGRRLAAEHPAPADLVVAVPDSGIAAASGYAQASGRPLAMGLVRSRNGGRTFIDPDSTRRPLGVRAKLAAVPEVLAGRRVVVVDDSLVRGTTARQVVEILRASGAREVHLRIASPPTVFPCYYGIDTPDRRDLIAARLGPGELRAFVTADSLAYLSQDGLLAAAGGGGCCDACFTGRYPVPPPGPQA